MMLTEVEEIELLNLLEQEEAERVAPKFELWREPAPYKSACGGRGAGAKSMSVASLLVQNMEYGRIKKWLCAREIQNTLEESSYNLILETIERLGYKKWVGIPTSSKIVNLKNRTYFRFMGLKDLKAAKGKKSIQGYDGCWVEECEDISTDIWDILLPTFRKDGAEIWTTFNRNRDRDPVYNLFFVKPPPGTIAIELEPGKIDNPWFPEILQRQMDHDYATRPDVAEHKWGGKPKAQGEYSVISRVKARKAAQRNIEDPIGGLAIGCDVARFGDDTTTIYKRHGMKIVQHKIMYMATGPEIARVIWNEFAGCDKSIPIRVDDTGVGGAVTDNLRESGAKVFAVSFNGKPGNRHKYTSCADEMWFEFPIDEADIPEDEELLDELIDRRYTILKDDRFQIEAKSEFKKRNGKSPDKADGLLLTYYQGGQVEIPAEIRQQMAERRRLGK
jgi:phage terminase large subunit